MEQRTVIETWFNEYLRIAEISDVSLNGIQVEGAEEVTTVAFAVDVGLSTFEKVCKSGAQMVVVHHGLYWRGGDTRLKGVMLKRVRPLLDAGVTLFAVHLPLDMHDEVGNNVELIRMIGARVTGGIGVHGTGFIGRQGEMAPQSLQRIKETYETILGTKAKLITSKSSQKVSKIAVLSGAASREEFLEAIEKGAELFITGEQSEWYHDAIDYGVSLLFLGHHASETTGPLALMKRFEKEFPQIKTVFIENPTGL